MELLLHLTEGTLYSGFIDDECPRGIPTLINRVQGSMFSGLLRPDSHAAVSSISAEGKEFICRLTGRVSDWPAFAVFASHAVRLMLRSRHQTDPSETYGDLLRRTKVMWVLSAWMILDRRCCDRIMRITTEVVGAGGVTLLRERTALSYLFLKKENDLVLRNWTVLREGRRLSTPVDSSLDHKLNACLAIWIGTDITIFQPIFGIWEVVTLSTADGHIVPIGSESCLGERRPDSIELLLEDKRARDAPPALHGIPTLPEVFEDIIDRCSLDSRLALARRIFLLGEGASCNKIAERVRITMLNVIMARRNASQCDSRDLRTLKTTIDDPNRFADGFTTDVFVPRDQQIGSWAMWMGARASVVMDVAGNTMISGEELAEGRQDLDEWIRDSPLRY